MKVNTREELNELIDIAIANYKHTLNLFAFCADDHGLEHITRHISRDLLDLVDFGDNRKMSIQIIMVVMSEFRKQSR